MAGKYPTPEEATSHYITGVEAKKDYYVDRCREGASKLGEWFGRVLPKVYEKVATLPEKTADVEENVKNRVVPIASLIKREAEAYRKEKARKVAEVARAIARPA